MVPVTNREAIMGKLEDTAASFGLKMVNEVETDVLKGALKDAGVKDYDTDRIYRCGYLAGANDGYMVLTPRFTELSRVIKSIYALLSDAMKRHDDIDVLTDLAAMHMEIAGYLVHESDLILSNTRSELARKTAVPEEYLDGAILLTDIPAKTLQEIGRKIAMQDTKKFSVYAVSGGVCGKNGPLTVEALADLVRNEGLVPHDVETIDVAGMLVRYGARQVREARKMYTQLQNSLEVFKKQHNNDATMITNRCISTARYKR